MDVTDRVIADLESMSALPSERSLFWISGFAAAAAAIMVAMTLPAWLMWESPLSDLVIAYAH